MSIYYHLIAFKRTNWYFNVMYQFTLRMKFFFQKENTKKRFLENEWNQWWVSARITTMNVSSQHIISLEEDWKSFEDPQLSKFLFGFHFIKRHWLVSTPISDLSRPRRVATNVHFQLCYSLLASNLNFESFLLFAQFWLITSIHSLVIRYLYI